MFSRRLDGCTGDAAVVAAVGKAVWNDTDEALYLHRISVGDDVAGLDPKAQRYESRTSGPEKLKQEIQEIERQMGLQEET